MDEQKAHREETLSSEEIYRGRVFTVTRDTARLENGSVVPREVVHHGGGAGIIALDEAGRVALVRQFRYAQGRELLEIPAGKVEAGEPPRETARRELAEEVGRTADRLVDFGSLIPTAAYCTEVIWLFLATGLRGAKQNLDADEFLTVSWMPLDEAVQLVLDGAITDAKTVAGLLRAKAWLEKNPL